MKSFSGRFVLRLGSKLHETLAKEAQSRGFSLNQIAMDFIQFGLKAKQSQRHPDFTKPLLKKLKQKMGGDLAGLLLFGSQVRKEATESSDWDLLIVLENHLPIKRELYRWWEKSFSTLSPKKVEPHFVHLPRTVDLASGIWFEVAMEGEIIYQKNRRIRSFLNQILLQVRTGVLQREWSHGHPYWVRRENEK